MRTASANSFDLFRVPITLHLICTLPERYSVGVDTRLRHTIFGHQCDTLSRLSLYYPCSTMCAGGGWKP